MKSKYDYILLTEGFQNWLEANHYQEAYRLSWVTQLVFFKLIHLFKLSDWSEWIQMTNTHILQILVMGSSAFVNAKKILAEEGLIIYKEGKHGSPSKYKLNDKMDFIKEAKIT